MLDMLLGVLPTALFIGAYLLGRHAYQGFRTAHRERRSWVAVLGSDPTPVAELIAMAQAAAAELGSWHHFSRQVTVAGTAGPMPDRDWRTPVSGQPCVWYHFRREQRTVRRSDGADRIETTLERDTTSGGRFVVTEDGSRVIVEVVGADVREVPTTVSVEPEELTALQRIRGIRKIDYVVTERFIPPGSPVTVAGMARATADSVSIRGDESGSVVISGATRSDLLRARQQLQVSTAWQSLAAAVGAVIAAIAAIVLW